MIIENMEVVYVVYRGDRPVYVGNMQECMAHFKVSPETVRYLATPAAKRRANDGIGSNALFALRVDVYRDREEVWCGEE